MRNHFSTLNLFDGGVVDLGVHFDCKGGTYILGKTIRVYYMEEVADILPKGLMFCS